VETFYIKDSYDDFNGLYAEDIAIIILVNKVSFNNRIAPVCIDWYSKYRIRNGDQGKVNMLY